MYPIEDIPDKDFLFMRIHENWISKGILLPGVFHDIGGGMSTDWSKYSTPEETKNRASQSPEYYGVISLNVKETRDIPNQEVKHSPNGNRAHTNVEGEKTPQVRIMFLRIKKWVINPPH